MKDTASAIAYVVVCGTPEQRRNMLIDILTERRRDDLASFAATASDEQVLKMWLDTLDGYVEVEKQCSKEQDQN